MATVAKNVGIESESTNYSLSPEKKLEFISNLQSSGHRVAMVRSSTEMLFFQLVSHRKSVKLISPGSCVLQILEIATYQTSFYMVFLISSPKNILCFFKGGRWHKRCSLVGSS